MSPHDRWRLQQMIEAAEDVQYYVVGRQRADLDTDRMPVYAIVRAVEIIGEAASKVSEETRSAQATIPWMGIIGMRNRLVHAHFDIDASIVRVAVTEEIPTLLAQLKALAASQHDAWGSPWPSPATGASARRWNVSILGSAAGDR